MTNENVSMRMVNGVKQQVTMRDGKYYDAQGQELTKVKKGSIFGKAQFKVSNASAKKSQGTKKDENVGPYKYEVIKDENGNIINYLKIDQNDKIVDFGMQLSREAIEAELDSQQQVKVENNQNETSGAKDTDPQPITTDNPNAAGDVELPQFVDNIKNEDLPPKNFSSKYEDSHYIITDIDSDPFIRNTISYKINEKVTRRADYDKDGNLARIIDRWTYPGGQEALDHFTPNGQYLGRYLNTGELDENHKPIMTFFDRYGVQQDS